MNAYLFYSLNEVREMCEEWRVDYNHERPHKALGYRSPIMYLKQWQEKNQCCSDRALSTPASETLIQIEAQPVVDKAAAEENIIKLKKSTFELTRKRGRLQGQGTGYVQ